MTQLEFVFFQKSSIADQKIKAELLFPQKLSYVGDSHDNLC